jgi:hypothetical protein
VFAVEDLSLSNKGAVSRSIRVKLFPNWALCLLSFARGLQVRSIPILTVLIIAASVFARADDGKKEAIAACAVALAPDVTILNSSSSLKHAWVRLITEKTYEAAKTQIKASGSIELLNLIGGSTDNSYEQFNEKRRDYLNLDKGEYQEDRMISIFRQTLPPQAGEHFVECVRIALTGSSGLHAWFSEESSSSAILHVKFRGSPNTSVSFRLSATGGTGAPAIAHLPHDGETQFNIKRTAEDPQIRIVLNSTNPAGLSDSAISVRPGAGITMPKPTFIPDQVWSIASAKSTGKCEYMISSKDMLVMAYDLPARSGLGLRISGNHVTPDAGDYPIAQTVHPDYTVLAIRSFGDIQLGPSSKLVLFGPGGAQTTLLKTPATTTGCDTFKLKFETANLTVRQPPAVYMESADSISETLEYKKSGNYNFMIGSVGCPGNCGDLYAANLVAKLSQPVARFEEISFISQSGSTQWYRCYATTPVCGTTGETTATTDRKSGSCIGQPTCTVWRFTTNGIEATDVIAMRYRSRQCVRYCAPPN